MRTMRHFVLPAAIVMAFATPALAGYGLEGLWRITTQIETPGMPAVSAQDRAQMERMGVKMSGTNAVTTQHCLTAAEASASYPPSLQDQNNCTMSNRKANGTMFSADMICRGKMPGRGRIALTYDSSVHYSGTMSFTGTADGQPVQMKQSFEGKWVSSACK